MLVDDIELFVGIDEIGSLLSLKGGPHAYHTGHAFLFFSKPIPLCWRVTKQNLFSNHRSASGVRIRVGDPQEGPDIEAVVLKILEF